MKAGFNVHEERERFAAAAIAFCLAHEDTFLWHFWRKVCAKDGEIQPRMKPIVDVEPHRWSDLLLKWDDVLCAVEIKIGATLEDHQNPGRKSFWNPGGYGHFLVERCKELHCNGRYVILGWRQEFGPRKRRHAQALEIEQRSWAALEDGLRWSALSKDLTSLLSRFGIWEFTFKNMKNKKLTGKLSDVGDAISILKSVRDSLGWPASFKVVAWAEEHWELGIYLSSYSRKKPVAGLAQKLKSSNEVPDHNVVAWFGYLAEAGTPEKRCVFVYCEEARRKRLVRRLNRAKFVVDEGRERDGEGGDYCAVVQGGWANLDDVNWFKKALQAAAGTLANNP